MINIGLESQQQIRGGDGQILWTGAQVVATSYIAKNNDDASSGAGAAFAMGEGAVWQPLQAAVAPATQYVTPFIPRQETTAAGATPLGDLGQSLVLGVRRIAAAADVGFLGVTQEPIGVGKLGLIAGPGSLTTVRTTTVAIAVGACVGGSATAGLAAAVAKGTAGLTLGICLKANILAATAPAGSGTNSLSYAGIMVAPA